MGYDKAAPHLDYNMIFILVLAHLPQANIILNKRSYYNLNWGPTILCMKKIKQKKIIVLFLIRAYWENFFPQKNNRTRTVVGY